jgi:hypothetical protein
MPFVLDTARLSDYDIRSLPHFTLRSKKRQEFSAACPFCGEGHDRFRYWPETGNYWCRQCDARGFVADKLVNKRVLLPRELADSKITSHTQEFHKWLEYNSTLFDYSEGLLYWSTALGPKFMEAVDYFGLGYCPNYKGLGPSVTIPIGYKGKVFIVKHRLLNNSTSRYTTEPEGVGALLFGLDDALRHDKIIITEGEKKAIRLWLEGYPAVSPSNGVNGFSGHKEWELFFAGKQVVVIYDPDEPGIKAGKELAERLNGVSIELPGKIDDLVNDGYDIRKDLGEPWMK